MKTILVSVDFSDVTSSLLEVARTFAGAFGGHVVLLHVSPLPLLSPVDDGNIPTEESDASMNYERLNDLFSKLEEAGLKASIEQTEGHATEAILKKAEELKADMIVIGSHGHGAVYNLLAGSVASGVLKSARCPVLVVPSPRK